MCLDLYTYFSISSCNPPADTWVQSPLSGCLAILVVQMVMIMFLTYDSFISLLDTEGDRRVNVARIILERIQQLTGRDYTQQHGS
jgi:hypothetical protein